MVRPLRERVNPRDTGIAPDRMAKKITDIAPSLSRDSLAEQIVREIVSLVKNGNLQPGDKLPAERKLAADLGVGRPTLREGLRALQLLGILDIRHGGGVFVADVPPDTLLGPLHLLINLDTHNTDTILEARKVIEGAVLAFVAPKIRDEHIDKLDSNLSSLEQLVASANDAPLDYAKFNELAQEFRAIIEDAAGNPILIRAVVSLDLLSAAARSRLIGSGSMERLVENHKIMVRALIRHDAQAARHALEAHIDYLCEISKCTAASGGGA